MNFEESELGFELKTDFFLAFFGKKEASIENLKKFYPHYSFKTLHQVHSNIIVQTKSTSVNDQAKADAHWTNEKGIALVVKSADCMPVLGYSSKDKVVMAIHAGWRGVANRIIPTALKMSPKWRILIGPHILQESFEIKEDCFNPLKDATRLNEKNWYEDGKADLHRIVLSQMEEVSIFSERVRSLLIDTKTDDRFHSFRRDGEKAGRQHSFIVRL